MSLFKKAEMTQAYLKMGILGFSGSGKSRTAAEVAIGLSSLLRTKKLPEGDRPIHFLDTETGSDYLKELIESSGHELFSAKTRSFADLIPAIEESAIGGSVLIIDSITHFWREFTESYAKKRQRVRLEFQDWNYLKTEWGKFTDAYVNSAAHIILCGRAGFEYDFVTDDNGKKNLEKTGIKMKAETEMGYEPSLLVLMEREQDMKTNQILRVASILKERFGVIDGKSIRHTDRGGPAFEDFMPHIERLNLGGTHLGVDSSRNSEGIIRDDGKPEWKARKEQVEIVLDEIQSLFVKHIPGKAAEEQKRKVELLEKHFGSTSWKRIETMKLEVLLIGRDALRNELEPKPFDQPITA